MQEELWIIKAAEQKHPKLTMALAHSQELKRDDLDKKLFTAGQIMGYDISFWRYQN